MTTALAAPMAKAESLLALGDLSKMNPDERAGYYLKVCESLGINHLTRPFEYLQLNGKLTLYARKDCTDQLRRVHGVSICEPSIKFEDDWIVVTIAARMPDGRTDSDIGVVNKKDMRGDYGNALMKAVTKAKRRVTLSICGLGMLDETEVETIPGVRVQQHSPQLTPKGIDPAEPFAPKQQANGDYGDAHEGDPPEVTDNQSFTNLARRKKWKWQNSLAWMNDNLQAGYGSGTKWADVSADHLRELVKFMSGEEPQQQGIPGVDEDPVETIRH